MSKLYINENRIILNEMIKIYKLNNYDWMSYLITKSNIITFHHIIEQSNGGLTVLENGALITKKAHRALNIVQNRDIILYDNWNDLFKEINKSNKPLDEYFFNCSRDLKKYTQKILYK